MNNMIKAIIFSVALLIICSGCATTKLATEAGTRIATSYQEAAASGTVTAEQSISSWPYISGLIKGLFAGNYDLDMPAAAKNIIDALDALSEQETLSTEDKGKVIGYFCRLEAMAIQEGWDRYGVSITSAIKSAFA